MIFDLLLIICIALFVVIGMYRGGVKTLCSLIATALAFVISIFLSAWIAAGIYNTFIAPKIINAVTNEITANSSQVIQNVSGVFPDFVNNILQSNGIDVNAIANGAAAQSAEAAAQAVETAVAACIISLLTVVLLIVIFILLRIVFSLVINIIDKAFNLPVLKQLNRMLGVVCGFIQGIIIVLLITAILQSSFSSAQPPSLLSEEYINSSFLFKYFYSGRILDGIIQMMS